MHISSPFFSHFYKIKCYFPRFPFHCPDTAVLCKYSNGLKKTEINEPIKKQFNHPSVRFVEVSLITLKKNNRKSELLMQAHKGLQHCRQLI